MRQDCDTATADDVHGSRTAVIPRSALASGARRVRQLRLPPRRSAVTAPDVNSPKAS
ncbi:hypothetical protein ACWGCW_25665 [Streptomyces sp. NPDC054933]